MAMNTLKSYSILVKETWIKSSGILFWGSIHQTFKMSEGVTAKYPWKGSKVNILLYINDPRPWFQKPKSCSESKLLKEAIHIKEKYQKHEYQFSKSSSSSMSWKVNTSLTQKDTMDRRAWIKFREKGIWKTQKNKRFKRHKSAIGMGMRNKWIVMFTICYDPMVSKLESTQRQK